MATRGYYHFLNTHPDYEIGQVKLYVHWDNYPSEAFKRIEKVLAESPNLIDIRNHFIKHHNAKVAWDFDGTINPAEEGISVDYKYSIIVGANVEGKEKATVLVYKEDYFHEHTFDIPQQHLYKSWDIVPLQTPLKNVING